MLRTPVKDRKKILLVGGGGREHAIVWKLRQSPRLERVYCTPGNAGISQEAITFDAPFGEGFSELVRRAKNLGIDYTLIGPEAPLAEGIVDIFEAEGLKVFRPVRARAHSSRRARRSRRTSCATPASPRRRADL